MKKDCISIYYKTIIEQRRKNELPISQFGFLRKSFDKFKIIKIRSGKQPAVITISGFLSENTPNQGKWEESIINTFPDQEWFHLEWNAGTYPFENLTNRWYKRFFRKDSDVVIYKEKDPGKELFSTLNDILNISTKHIRIPYILINNNWHLAIRNSKIAGEMLAQTLLTFQEKEFILVGHSLGARVIHNCLEFISKEKIGTSIKEVHLLGGAVNSRDKKWNKTKGSVKTKYFNYFSKNDSVLKFAFGAIMIDRFPIGLHKVNLPDFENIDTTKDISGHTEYISNFHKIFKMNI